MTQIQTVRTASGPRYYVRRNGTNGKLMRAGYKSKTAALEHIRLLEVMDRAQEELRGQIKALRNEARP